MNEYGPKVNPLAFPNTINHLKLTVRARNVLRAKNIKTIEQLTLLTRFDLLKIPDIGKTTLQDIEAELAVLNLRLKGVL